MGGFVFLIVDFECEGKTGRAFMVGVVVPFFFSVLKLLFVNSSDNWKSQMDEFERLIDSGDYSLEIIDTTQPYKHTFRFTNKGNKTDIIVMTVDDFCPDE